MLKRSKSYNKGTPLWKALLFEHRLPGRYKIRLESLINTIHPIRYKILKLASSIRKEVKILLHDSEIIEIVKAIKKTKKVEGDIAEVGIYKGGSAKIICEFKGNKPLYLFDTFEGLVDVDKKLDDNSLFFNRRFKQTSFERVKRYLNKYNLVYIYKGIFPDTGIPIKNKKFSFVHLDVDTYKSTLDCLKFFYSRMSRKGIIISHDYSISPGVRNAFTKFFKNKPETIHTFEKSICQSRQCLIKKL